MCVWVKYTDSNQYSDRNAGQQTPTTSILASVCVFVCVRVSVFAARTGKQYPNTPRTSASTSLARATGPLAAYSRNLTEQGNKKLDIIRSFSYSGSNMMRTESAPAGLQAGTAKDQN